jgi:hypothetical protein
VPYLISAEVGPLTGKNEQPPVPSKERANKEIKPHRKLNMNFPGKDFLS